MTEENSLALRPGQALSRARGPSEPSAVCQCPSHVTATVTVEPSQGPHGALRPMHVTVQWQACHRDRDARSEPGISSAAHRLCDIPPPRLSGGWQSVSAAALQVVRPQRHCSRCESCRTLRVRLGPDGGVSVAIARVDSPLVPGRRSAAPGGPWEHQCQSNAVAALPTVGHTWCSSQCQ